MIEEEVNKIISIILADKDETRKKFNLSTMINTARICRCDSCICCLGKKLLEQSKLSELR